MKHFLYFSISLSLAPWVSLHSQTVEPWWNQEFTIGLNLDPPHSTATKDWDYSALWDSAAVAGFNLSVGVQYKHGHHTDMTPPEEEAARVGIRYLHYDTNLLHNVRTDSACAVSDKLDLLSENTHFCGIHIKDEPTERDSAAIHQLVRGLRSEHPDGLFFVNLFPAYYHENDWDKYGKYARSYLSDTTLLQVVCFDNYYPNSQFTNTPNDGTPPYYSNLSLLRQLSGNRPLWSYVLTTEKRLVSHCADWQRAFLRLSAFAPLAYGCKGLIYYTFDTPDGGHLYRDFSYRTNGGWEQPLYYHAQDGEAEVFVGRFRTNDTGYYDVAVKSDSLNGCWRVKFAESTTESLPSDDWNLTLADFGNRSYTESFIGDWDGDGLDEFMAFVRDGRLFVSYTLGGWRHFIPLQDFPTGKAANIHRTKLAVGRFDNDTQPDFCIAWPEEEERYRIRTYLDYQAATNTFTSYTDRMCDSLLHLHQTNSGRLYAFSRDSVYTFGKSNGKWGNGQPIQIGEQQENIFVQKDAHHFWTEPASMGSDLFYGQTTEGEIYRGQSDSYSLEEPLPDYTTNLLSIYSLENPVTKEYDIYGIPRKQFIGFPALLDYRQRTTERYGMVKSINQYLRETLAPIVLSSSWRGVWHGQRPPNEVDTLVHVVDDTAPILKQLDSKLMAGLFELDDTVCRLLVVNKDNQQHQCSRMVLRGNRTGRVTLLPRIDTGDNGLSVTFRPDSMDTVVEWTNMTGGECVAFRIVSIPPRKAKEDYDGDGLSDFLVADTLTTDSIQQKIYLSSQNYTGSPVAYNFPFTPGNIRAYTVAAAFDGDGRCDLSLLDGASGCWWFRLSATGFPLTAVGIPTDSTAVPFAGDYNGDGSSDLCYRLDADENLRITLSDCGVFDGDVFIGNLYGSSDYTYPTCGDWDGDGVDDLSLYRSDNKLLIDYSKGSVQGLGHWNDVLPLAGLTGTYDFPSLLVTNGDYDGDGLQDFCLVTPYASMTYLDFGYNGYGYWEISIPNPQTPSGYILTEICSGDWDGDGLEDVCYRYHDPSSANTAFKIDFSYNGFVGIDKSHFFTNSN